MTSTSNLTAGFVDLATYDELEKNMYGGKDAIVYFVRETRKSTWFTQVPVQLAKCEGIADFGQDWSVSISRSGDYLLGTWLHVNLPAVSVAGWNAQSVCVAWTPNFMHSLIKNCCISFNDLVAARFDGTHLDFWAAFTTPASKAEGYRHMIGSQIPTCGGFIPAQSCDLPLPFFYTRDSGVALPTAALPYNEMRISFTFRKWEELLVGFAPKVECINYGIGNHEQNVPYIIPSYNSSYSGIQPCWNNAIWPSCSTSAGISGNNYTNNLLKSGGGTELPKDQLHQQYQNSSELSFIILPKLEGVPTAYLQQSGQNQVTQNRDTNQTNFDMRSNVPFYVGEPSSKNEMGVYCDMKELSLKCEVWANYAIVSNEERQKMACGPRDLLIEQIQQTPATDFNIRNQPDSRWWPNNIPELQSVDASNNGKLPQVDQAPAGSGAGFSSTGPTNQFVENNTNVPTNSVSCDVQHWQEDANNYVAQQPSGQKMCLTSQPLNTSATHKGWNIGTVDNKRENDFDGISPTVHLNLRYSHAVKALFFAAKNVTAQNIHSNYTIGFPVLQPAVTDQVTLDGPVFSKGIWDRTIDYSWNNQSENPTTNAALTANELLGKSDANPSTAYRPYKSGGIAKYVGKIQNVTQSVITCKNGFDPIEKTSLMYETTPRLGLLDSSYYSLVQPYYHAPSLPASTAAPVFCPTGYHMYSYSLEFAALDPLGSTNFGKLTNVALDAEPIKINSSNICPELSYAVPHVNGNATDEVNPKYLYGPINAPGLVGDETKTLRNQTVLEVLINMAYQNIYEEAGYDTVSPMMAPVHSGYIAPCTFLGKYSFVSTAINNNVMRISGGSVGFPVL